MSSFTLRTAFVCLLQIKLLCFVCGSTAWPEEYPEQGRLNARPLGRKVLSHPSRYNASSLTDSDDFLSLLNRRKLLSSYSSCGCSNSCGSGTVYIGYTYDGCSGCCSNSWGTCNWYGDGKQYKTECAECNSNSDCDSREYCSSTWNSCYSCHSSCKTCTTYGSGGCASCYSGSFLDAGWGSNDDYCKSCHESCTTCDGEWSSDCLSCPSGKYLSYDYGGLGSSGYCVECTQDSHCGSGETCSSNTCSGCHSTCATCDSTGSSDCLSCPIGKHLSKNFLDNSGNCVTCTEDWHCPGGSVCDVSTLLTTGSYVCILPEEDDGSWWCPEQDDNFWNFDMDAGTRGTYGFSQVYRMKVNGKTCSYNWVSEEFELQMQGNPKSESVIFSFSYGDFKDINLGIFTAETLDGGLCAPIPALSFGTYGFGAGLYICLAIENFDITNEVMKGELHMQLTAKVDLVIQKYEYDLNSQLLTTFNIDESDENIDLDALPTDLPVAYAASACPSVCSSLSVGSAEACLTGVLSCQACDLAVCKSYLAETEILKEGVQASSPPSTPSSPNSPNSPSGLIASLTSGATYMTSTLKLNILFGFFSTISVALMLA